MSKGNIINILEDYFLFVENSDVRSNSSTTNAIFEIHNAIENNTITKLVADIDLNNSDDINRKIDESKAYLCSLNENIRNMAQTISYFKSEITDNMQRVIRVISLQTIMMIASKLN